MAKSWNTVVWVGTMPGTTYFKYYLQPQLRLIDDAYKFQSVFNFIGIGYEVRPTILLWLMDGYYVIRRLSGKYRHENIIRQQLNWEMINTSKFIFSDTTRLEERKDFDDSPWSFRIRQMLTIRLPIQSWPHHSVVLFDEIFFNLNNPGWTDTQTTIDQNRFFVGIGTQLSKQVSFDIGYIKQYEWRIEHDQNSNILYFILNVVVD